MVVVTDGTVSTNDTVPTENTVTELGRGRAAVLLAGESLSLSGRATVFVCVGPLI